MRDALRKALAGLKLLANAGGLLALLLMVSPAVRAAMGELPASWGTIAGALLSIQQDGDIVPTAANVLDLGDSTHPWANAWISNLTSGSDIAVTDDLTVTDALNVTGTTTLNALVGNSTGNFTGTVTGNAFVVNTTLNTTGLATLDNATVNGSVNASANVSVGQILSLAKTTVNATNATLSGNTSYVALVNMSGNHTLTLPDAAASGTGALILVAEACNLIGGTGNLTVNATGGDTVNGAASVEVTNTSGATGNVSRIDCLSDGTNWTLGVIRR